jgi:hypothetical protein
MWIYSSKLRVQTTNLFSGSWSHRPETVYGGGNGERKGKTLWIGQWLLNESSWLVFPQPKKPLFGQFPSSECFCLSFRMSASDL